MNSLAQLLVWRGEFAEAAALIGETDRIAAATGTRFPPYVALMLAGSGGQEAEAAQLIETVSADARAAGQGLGIRASHWAAAILYNGLARYETAGAEAQQAAAET